jgi:predicted kinase
MIERHPPPRPAVLVMCGMPASGKTTTAARIHAVAGGALVRSCDVFADLGINVPEWVGRTHGFTRDVERFQLLRVAAYREMARRTTAALEAGTGLVIVDAVHGARASRDGVYALALRFGATPVLVWCRCDDFEEITRRFAARRGREHVPEHEASDLSVYRNISDHWQDPSSDRLPDGAPVPTVIFDTLRQRLVLPAEPKDTVALVGDALRVVRDALGVGAATIVHD